MRACLCTAKKPWNLKQPVTKRVGMVAVAVVESEAVAFLSSVRVKTAAVVVVSSQSCVGVQEGVVFYICSSLLAEEENEQLPKN